MTFCHIWTKQETIRNPWVRCQLLPVVENVLTLLKYFNHQEKLKSFFNFKNFILFTKNPKVYKIGPGKIAFHSNEALTPRNLNDFSQKCNWCPDYFFSDTNVPIERLFIFWFIPRKYLWGCVWWQTWCWNEAVMNF